MRIVIENLRQNISEDEIREELNQFAEIEKIELIDVGSALVALIGVATGLRERTYALATYINGRIF